MREWAARCRGLCASLRAAALVVPPPLAPRHPSPSFVSPLFSPSPPCSGVLLKPVASLKLLNAKTLKAATGWLVAYLLAGSV